MLTSPCAGWRGGTTARRCAGAAAGTGVSSRGNDILRVAGGHVVEYRLNAGTLDLTTRLQVGAG